MKVQRLPSGRWGWLPIAAAMLVASASSASAQLTDQQKRGLPRSCSAAEMDSISRLQSDQAAHGIDLKAAMRVGMRLSGPCGKAWNSLRPSQERHDVCTPRQKQRMLAYNGTVQFPNNPALDCHRF